MFKPNDKVVCVNDEPGYTTGKRELQKGVVYTVRGVVGRPQWQYPAVYLVGIIGESRRSQLDDELYELPFRASRFRLVSEVGHPPIAVAIPEEVTP